MMRWEIEIPQEDGEGDYYSSRSGLYPLLAQLCALVGHRPLGWELEPGLGELGVKRLRCRTCEGVYRTKPLLEARFKLADTAIFHPLAPYGARAIITDLRDPGPDF